jgi:hypothetical protein
MSENVAIQLYGDAAEVRVLAGRIKAMMPGGQRYTDPEAHSLAQISVAHGLDPFNGECWLIKDSHGNPRGVTVGIKGLRKHAKGQSMYWGVSAADAPGGFRRLTDNEEIALHKCGPNDIVFEYKIADQEQITAWAATVKALKDAGQDGTMAGEAPITVGIGIWKNGEKSLMKPTQCAMYRAERDALRRRFDVNFSLPGLNVGVADITEEPNGDDTVEGEFDEIEELDETPEEIISSLGYDVSTGVEDVKDPMYDKQEQENGTTIDRPYEPDQLKAAFGKMCEVYAGTLDTDLKDTDRQMVVVNIEKLFKTNQEDSRYDLCEFLFGPEHRSSKDLTAPMIKSMIKWLAWSKDSGGDWGPTGACTIEAPMVIAALANAKLEQQPTLL